MSATIEMRVKGPDWNDIEKEIDKAIDDGMEELKGEIESRWQRKAREKFSASTAEKYLEGLSFDRAGSTIYVTLSGRFPEMLELGAESYDLKPGFLGNRVSRIIPFTPRQIFRTVRTDSGGWIHPGFTGKKINEEIKEEIDTEIAPRIFDQMVSKIQL